METSDATGLATLCSAEGSALTLVVPAFNEEASLREAVDSLVASVSKIGILFEVIIIDDGSCDRTRDIAEFLARNRAGIRTLHHDVNRGLGSALQTGIANASNGLILLCPVDNPLSEAEIERFVSAMSNGADIVVGYRRDRPGYSAWQRFGSRCYQRFVCWLFDLKVRDVNWIHIYRREAVRALGLKQRGFVFLTEVLAKAQRMKWRIAEVPCAMRPRLRGRATVSRPSVIVKAVWALCCLWLELRNPEWRQRGSRRMV